MYKKLKMFIKSKTKGEKPKDQLSDNNTSSISLLTPEEKSKTDDPFIEDKLPNSFMVLATGLFGTLTGSFFLILGIGFFNYLFTSFYLPNTLILIKYCAGLVFWVMLSSLPIIGVFFIGMLFFQSVQILNLLAIPAELNIWISFIIFFIVAIQAFLYNTLYQIILLKEDYKDMELKKKYQRYTVIVYVSSVIIGIILIFTSDIIFSFFFGLILAM